MIVTDMETVLYLDIVNVMKDILATAVIKVRSYPLLLILYCCSMYASLIPLIYIGVANGTGVSIGS